MSVVLSQKMVGIVLVGSLAVESVAVAARDEEKKQEKAPVKNIIMMVMETKRPNCQPTKT
ncbi:hypothetical protein AT864_03072 [Anoxybacillus sp. P3H1B]|uniref:hypothetical protein n=1 Tax=Anoxybacillaceae TaxID=3120669 RepID=UPI0007925923|nr:hypothetical protein [Anoxybacillus sp. P3H1B]KXG08655.1 hypothetical protein AT864_03072 [Anoxybacillus sp. P3H1B]